MEFWIRSRDDGRLDAVDGQLRTLLRLSEVPDHSLLLASFSPASEYRELTSFLRLAGKLGTDLADIVILTAHPSSAWLRDLAEDGFGDLRFSVADDPEAFRPPGIEVGAAAGAVCPELHVACYHERTLSVCGAHGDRLVLSPRHMSKWCMSQHGCCPYRHTVAGLPGEHGGRDSPRLLGFRKGGRG
jgi:hypothetical protein